MKIQAGKFYRTRDGRKVGPMRNSDRGSSGAYPFVATHTGQSWTADGHYWVSGTLPSPADLIAEWVELPADVTPWAGGDCPVNPEAYVLVWRRGRVPLRIEARTIRWDNTGSDGDIIGYQVLWAPAVKRSGERWVNIFIYDGGKEYGVFYHTRAQADADDAGRIACIHMTWTEGDGL